ncbi:hypothetical protein BDW69DRAFT_185489 [Aspergillus filifer]
MAPKRSWTALVLFSPLVTSIPLPLQPAESEYYSNTNIHPSLEARSPAPAPDPRMVPNKTDLLSNLFAKLGMEQLDELNKLHHDEQPEDNTVVDDSQGATVTVTRHDNYFDVVASPVASPASASSASPSAGASPNSTSTSTSNAVVSTSAGSGASIIEGQDSVSDTDGDAETDRESDPTEDPQGFVDSLFDELRKKFREVINGSDEVTLR